MMAYVIDVALFLPLTVGLFYACVKLVKQLRLPTLFHPVLLSSVLLLGLVLWGGVASESYHRGSRLLHELLAPATVAFALPLYRNRALLRRSFLPIAWAILGGGAVAAAVAMLTVAAGHGGAMLLASLAPKSVTTPIAMAISKELGGRPEVTVLAVMATGLLGAMIGPGLLARFGIKRPEAQGLALGVASHGIGASRAVELGPRASGFAGLAVALTGLATAVLLPLVFIWLH